MRISDWSSDVCSSDLHGQPETRQGFGQGGDIGLDAGRLEAEKIAGAPAPHLDVVDDEQHVVRAAHAFELFEPAPACDIHAALALYRLDDHGRRMEIGRASCRERVWQYV